MEIAQQEILQMLGERDVKIFLLQKEITQLREELMKDKQPTISPVTFPPVMVPRGTGILERFTKNHEGPEEKEGG